MYVSDEFDPTTWIKEKLNDVCYISLSNRVDCYCILDRIDYEWAKQWLWCHSYSKHTTIALSKKEDGQSYNGKIKITWGTIANSLVWSWEETGGPEVREPTITGFGTRLIKRAFSGQGFSLIEYNPKGMKCTISLDLNELKVSS